MEGWEYEEGPSAVQLPASQRNELHENATAQHQHTRRGVAVGLWTPRVEEKGDVGLEENGSSVGV